MLYLLYGTEKYQIEKEIKKISKKFDKLNITNYNLEEDTISSIIDDCKTISLFSEEKLIIVDNANVFTPASKQSESLEEYLKNPNESTTLIFIVNKEKIDSRKKITKLIKEKGEIKEYNQTLNINTLIKKELKDYNTPPNVINLLEERVGNNPQIILNEIEKIKIYKDKDKNITEEDIINLTHKKIDIDIFKLIDNIVKNDKNKALETYYEMLKTNEEPLKIIIMLANQFRIMYQSKNLIKKGLTEKDIANTLKIHPYRVKLALQNSRTYSPKLLLKFINELAQMDINIKTGKISKNLALELFILNK